jgi:hypothetical protein
MDKHSSLFYPTVSDDKKVFVDVDLLVLLHEGVELVRLCGRVVLELVQLLAEVSHLEVHQLQIAQWS